MLPKCAHILKCSASTDKTLQAMTQPQDHLPIKRGKGKFPRDIQMHPVPATTSQALDYLPELSTPSHCLIIFHTLLLFCWFVFKKKKIIFNFYYVFSLFIVLQDLSFRKEEMLQNILKSTEPNPAQVPTRISVNNP